MDSTFKVKGLGEIGKFLEQFPKRLANNAMRAGVTAACAVFRDEMRLLAPRETGTLAAGIKTGSSKVNQDGTVSARVRLTGKHAYLGVFFEWGVLPHSIAARETLPTAKRRRAGKFKLKIGDKFVSGPVQHPGFSARPFMRPAFDMKKEEAAAAFRDKIRTYINAKTGITLPEVEVDD